MIEHLSLKHWTLERDFEGIAWLGFDREGETVNSLSRDVLLELGVLLDSLSLDLPTGLVIYSNKESGFIAGADIREFDQQQDLTAVKASIEVAHHIFDKLDALPCPTVASIKGYCLGGGLELALACDYRVALDSDSTRIGFPEIQLGIFPGFGGTARSIRLLGGYKALTLILSSRTLKARTAKSLGLIDQVVPKHTSLRWAARKTILKKQKNRSTSWLEKLTSSFSIRHVLAKIMEIQVAKRARPEHYPAPYVLIDLWRQAGRNFTALLNGEVELVSKLLMGDTSINLRRIFRLQEQLRAQAKIDSHTPNATSQWTPRRVHVVGAGVMGGDIAAWCALSGLEVTLQDRDIDSIAVAVKCAEKLFTQKLKTPALIIAAKSRLITDIGGSGISRADIIIEAIYENLEAKQQLFMEIEQCALPHALLATNTSAIPLADIASTLQQPERLIGLHFFNPVAKMPLIEIVRDNHTPESMIKKACIFSNLIRKYPLSVKSAPGFLVNRVLAPFMFEALNLVEEGHSMATIDEAALLFGMPMGPIEIADTVGLDISMDVATKLAPNNTTAIQQLQIRLDEGKLGKKSGAGFYRWKQGKPVKQKPSNQVALDVLGMRLIEPLLKECQHCLDEGIVMSADLLDAGIVFGIGFAPFRGGPLHYFSQLKQKNQPNYTMINDGLSITRTNNEGKQGELS